ncbi:UPF0182 family membrane protein [Parenemella sanctibonifatiensis]|uniref:UPF0182 protein CGZ91_05400 n=1 Tax=Parenemella sanctibonifatiensis TaxID=2016505 RepID=A0A255EI50_9ACTN|nr:UPF0182 family protein [Parenemella sanctibonifatiensis]OYN90920.1 hypothetical protein CGZ91_05400 [Parenemella sanctibonifatiensis]
MQGIRGRRPLLVPILAGVAVLVVAFLLFTGVWTNKLWFASVGFGQVYSTQLWTQIGLFVVFALIGIGMVVGSAALAFRLRPKIRSSLTRSAILERYRQLLERRFWVAMIAPSLITGLVAGTSGVAQWMTYLSWRHSTPFGEVDPEFGIDIGFFVFELQWWRFLAGFLTTAIGFAIVFAVVVHYAVGAISFKGTSTTVRRPAQIQIAVLVGLGLLAYAASGWLDRYGMAIQDNQMFTGLGYTDVNARLVARLVLSVIAVLCAVLFFVSPIVRRWGVPLAAVVLMLVSGVVIGMIYPAIVQGFTVEPNRNDVERPYVQRHIEATREAFDVNDVTMVDYDATVTAEPGQLSGADESLRGIRLLDPARIGATFDRTQRVRDYYGFPNLLDVGRYDLDGQENDVVLAAREINPAGVDQSNWNSRHTVYTHGFGLVAAYGNRVQPSGQPDWIMRDIPPVGELSEHEPRIYFGESMTDYAVVGAPEGTEPWELDTPGSGGGADRTYTYRGEGGVPIGDPMSQLLYAVRFADINLLLSERVTDESKILYNRTPQQRIQSVAPWLRLDTNAFPAIVDGRIKWIVDGYTTSSSYPNSQLYSLQQGTADSQRPGISTGQLISDRVNYMRNSVKAVVDAYDGTVSLYAWDEEDPVLQTWRKAYPEAVLDRSEIPEDLLNHVRYPEDMFKMQREVLSRYHVTDPGQWIEGSNVWQVPMDPVSGNNKEPAYYMQVQMPEESDVQYRLTATLVPRDRPNMAAYMTVVADATSPDYGQLVVLRMPPNSPVPGVGQVQNNIETNEGVANALRPFRNNDSAEVVTGNLLTLPVGGGLLHVQPVYTRQATEDGYPVLQFVVASFGERIGIGEDLETALDQVFAGDAGVNTDPSPGGSTPTGPADNPAAVQALEEAERAFEEADELLRQGDLAGYQQKMAEAREATERALAALGRG